MGRDTIEIIDFFIFWDSLFASVYDAPRRLTSEDIGLDYDGYPTDYLGGLKAPLLRYETVASRDIAADPVGQN